MEQEFHRIRRLPPYVFAEVDAMKARARAAGDDIIDLGMGNPDTPTPQHIVDKLVETVQNPKTHRYSSSRGIPGLRKAVSAYYERRFNVAIDPVKEAVVTIGSKEGLANLSSAITSPGDVILVPNPSYPIHQFGFIIAGAAARNIPVTPGPDFMAALERAVQHSVPKPTAVVLNYPNNPTAELADLDFYGQVVDFCRYHGIYILSDLAYAEIYFDGDPPPSILEVPGARDIAVEFTSMSKTYSMPGWRIGFATGNSKMIEALARNKSYLDYGASRRSRWPRPRRSTVRRNVSRRSASATRTAATCSSTAWPRPGGTSRGRPPPCSPGRRSRRSLRISARWNSPSCCCRRRRWRLPPVLALASMGTNTCGWPWSRTANESARPFAASRPSSTATTKTWMRTGNATAQNRREPNRNGRKNE